MKTLETETTLSKVYGIINPVRIITVEEWMKVATLLVDERLNLRTGYEPMKNHIAIQLLSRFEELTQGKWEYKTVG